MIKVFGSLNGSFIYSGRSYEVLVAKISIYSLHVYLI